MAKKIKKKVSKIEKVQKVKKVLKPVQKQKVVKTPKHVQHTPEKVVKVLKSKIEKPILKTRFLALKSQPDHIGYLIDIKESQKLNISLQFQNANLHLFEKVPVYYFDKIPTGWRCIAVYEIEDELKTIMFAYEAQFFFKYKESKYPVAIYLNSKKQAQILIKDN